MTPCDTKEQRMPQLKRPNFTKQQRNSANSRQNRVNSKGQSKVPRPQSSGSFTERVQQFMQGRNGVDELAFFCIEIALILVIINIFARNVVLTILIIAALAYAVFRIVSPNINARRQESMTFARALGPVRPWITNPVAAFTNNRTYKHGRCPHCGQQVRVPRGKGLLRVTCPKCGEKFDLKS